MRSFKLISFLSSVQVISPDDFDAVLPRLIDGILAMYRREQDLLQVTQV
jgi:hypothetical protein